MQLKSLLSLVLTERRPETDLVIHPVNGHLRSLTGEIAKPRSFLSNS
jgi:hypothetical protein